MSSITKDSNVGTSNGNKAASSTKVVEPGNGASSALPSAEEAALRFEEISANLASVREKITSTIESSTSSFTKPIDSPATLVAVSKLKPASDILHAYHAGQRHFGENYVNEICEKTSLPEPNSLPDDIKWHFIGNLQKNKVNKLIKTVQGRLHVVESVDTLAVAKQLNLAWQRLKEDRVKEEAKKAPKAKKGNEKQNSDDSKANGKPLHPISDKLKVFVQVNTSSEDSKSGCEPSDCVDLVRTISNDFTHIQVAGLMTIGKFGDPNPGPYFEMLRKCGEAIYEAAAAEPAAPSSAEESCSSFKENLPPKADFELSMGMSGDFQQAIEAGSTNVRVGSKIFGARPKKT
eukprot:g2651.t1